jgi:branched-chain amino acid transport system permease protein
MKKNTLLFRIIAAGADHHPTFIIALAMIILYIILPSKMMASEILIMAIPTVAFILLLGYTGLLNFATGSLFAVGAYTTGILLARYHVHILLALFSSIILSGILAVIMGYLCIKRGGLIFALLTLAFNQLIWFTIWHWRSLTGGSDGIWGIQRSTLSFGLFAVNLKPTFNFFIFVLIVFLVIYIFVQRLIEAPFGKTLQSMRENELRATALGYNPETYKWIAFILSGMICGLGGALFSLHQEYVGEHLANWHTSGEIVIMALLGGAFTLSGALVGSGVFIFIADVLNKFNFLSKSGAWLLVLGVVFIVVVMFFRGGIVGGTEKLYETFRKRSQ